MYFRKNGSLWSFYHIDLNSLVSFFKFDLNELSDLETDKLKSFLSEKHEEMLSQLIKYYESVDPLSSEDLELWANKIKEV